MWIRFINIFLNIIFPEKCLGCGEKGFLICKKCIENLPMPISTYVENPIKIFPTTSYSSKTIKKAIRELKYRKVKRLAKIFADLIHTRIFLDKTNLLNYRHPMSIVVPVPLSKKRLRQRGFNQAELIAKHLSDKIGVDMYKNVLYKIKETASQVDIKDRGERLKNLKGVFSIKPRQVGQVKNKTVFLVDDVSTTGATLFESAKVLKKAGAKEVIGIVVAR